VTGHSLGGAIATYVSLRRTDASTYIFNSSPGFWKRGRIPENRRLSIARTWRMAEGRAAPGARSSTDLHLDQLHPGVQSNRAACNAPACRVPHADRRLGCSRRAPFSESESPALAKRAHTRLSRICGVWPASSPSTRRLTPPSVESSHHALAESDPPRLHHSSRKCPSFLLFSTARLAAVPRFSRTRRRAVVEPRASPMNSASVLRAADPLGIKETLGSSQRLEWVGEATRCQAIWSAAAEVQRYASELQSIRRLQA
jgi:hypothetical protein